MTELRQKNRKKLAILSFIIAASITVFGALKARHETIIRLQASEDTNDAIQAMIDTGKFGYAIVSQDGNVTEWNNAMEELTGRSKEEVVREGLRAVMDESTWKKHQSAFRRAMSNPDLTQVVRVTCKIPPNDKHKQEIPVTVTLRVVRTRHNNLFAIAHIDKQEQILDIEQEKQ